MEPLHPNDIPMYESMAIVATAMLLLVSYGLIFTTGLNGLKEAILAVEHEIGWLIHWLGRDGTWLKGG